MQKYIAMKRKIYLPSKTLLDTEASKIIAESPEGSFCLLPRHIDCVTALVQGIFSYFDQTGREYFLALNGGILTKQKEYVFVVTRHAVAGELGNLLKEVDKMVSVIDEREKTARSAVARLEAGFLRRFMEFSKHG